MNTPEDPISPEQLRACCDAIGWSVVALSRVTGVRASTVSRWFSGATRVPLPIGPVLRALADFHRANPFPAAPPWGERHETPRQQFAEPGDVRDLAGGVRSRSA